MALSLQGALPRAAEPIDAERSTGLLPSQRIREAVLERREIRSQEPIGEDQVQPASLDLRLGEVAYRVRASFLPGPRHTVDEKLDLLSMHRIDLTKDAVLEKDCVYIVPLLESLALGRRRSAGANPKSSTGRLDVFARVITDYGSEFDRVREGYKGPLYAELSPRSFSILVRAGSRLVQLRLRRGSPAFHDAALRRLQEKVGLIEGPAGAPCGRAAVKGGLAFTVDVSGEESGGVVGFKARRHTGLIDVDRVGHYDPLDFWEPVYPLKGRLGILLDPNDFTILATREAVAVPPDHAAEMLPYNTFVGEFRVHFAGFFDPGFGTAEGAGSRAVLEVRSHEVPFLMEDGQVIGRLVYERLLARPDKLYGPAIGSSYQRQGLALSKHFKPLAPR